MKHRMSVIWHRPTAPPDETCLHSDPIHSPSKPMKRKRQMSHKEFYHGSKDTKGYYEQMNGPFAFIVFAIVVAIIIYCEVNS